MNFQASARALLASIIIKDNTMTDLLKVSATAVVLVIGTLTHAVANEDIRAQVAANVLEADADADGALTLDEFTTLIDLNAHYGIGRSQKIQRTGRYSLVFGRLDSNADGVVTKDEMEAMMARVRR
jgi:Ca2+-binding EF-hand superfamily protein